MKTLIAVMFLAVGAIAYAEDESDIVHASVSVIQDLTTQNSVTCRITAGTNAINGFDWQYFKPGGAVSTVHYPDVIQPFDTFNVETDGLDCDTGYRFREKAVGGQRGESVATLTSPCG